RAGARPARSGVPRCGAAVAAASWPGGASGSRELCQLSRAERVHAVSLRARRVQGESARTGLRCAACAEAQRGDMSRLSHHGPAGRRRTMRRLATMLLLVGTGAVCGCRSPGDDQPTGSVDSATWRAARDLPAGVAEALD